jgi:hypothetical protein
VHQRKPPGCGLADFCGWLAGGAGCWRHGGDQACRAACNESAFIGSVRSAVHHWPR